MLWLKGKQSVKTGQTHYQRNEKALVLALMEMYVEGVSTRKVKEVTKALCGTSFSKSLVSSLAGRLDAELEGWLFALNPAPIHWSFITVQYIESGTIVLYMRGGKY